MLASLKPSQQADILASLTDEEAAELEYDWGFWGRPAQQEPEGDWSNWLILAGRGFGKTRTGAEWVSAMAGRVPLIALVGETAADVRDVMIEGESGIMACSRPDTRPAYFKSLRKLIWPNGAEAHCYSGEDPDQLRGPQHNAAWIDELCKMQYAQDTWDQLSFGLRLRNGLAGPLEPRALITTTPRPLEVLRNIMADPDTVIVRGRTLDNAANLSPKFIKSIRRRYEGTRLGRQELDAEVLDDMPGALWTREMLARAGTKAKYQPADLRRVVIGVDPSGSDGETGGMQGIVAAAEFANGTFGVLEDASGQRSPQQWAKAAVALYYKYNADRIVAEKNFGGAMVEHTIRTAARDVPVTMVTASRGKHLRAEPIAALYEQERVRHCMRGMDGEEQSFAALEDQMCLTTNLGYEGESSPDRLDAAVWALTELSGGPRTQYFGVI